MLYIVMERVDGEMMGQPEKWEQMSEVEREGIWGQLKEMWKELREIVRDRGPCVRLVGEHYMIIGFGARLALRGWVLLRQRGNSFFFF